MIAKITKKNLSEMLNWNKVSINETTEVEFDKSITSEVVLLNSIFSYLNEKWEGNTINLLENYIKKIKH